MAPENASRSARPQPAETDATQAGEAPAGPKAVGVEIENLSKSFGDQEVLRNVSFSVQSGEIFALMGPSGSGKSVLLKHIVGLELPSGGRVLVDGMDAADPETRKKVAVALVFQAGALFNSLSVFDNLALYPREHRLYDRDTLRERVMYTLQILSLEKAADKFPAELSGGMRKRVSIARALVMEPQLILYDEPTSELDPVMGASISEIIASLRENFSVTSLVVSHDRDLALTIADRVGIIMNGEIVALETPQKLKQNSDPAISDFLNPKIDLKNPRFKQLELANE